MITTPELWGIVNVTPDSFSDGGLFVAPEVAVAHARELLADGASVIDVGGESTRPGAPRVSVEEEQARVLPVISALVAEGITVSIDTMNASTAVAAIDAGVRYVNDVSGGLADPDMVGVIAHSSVDYVVMHWRGHSEHMDALATYDDVVLEVSRELQERLETLQQAGVTAKRIVIDPGLGFAKTPQHNWAVVAGMETLVALGHRVLVGASRKRFLGEIVEGEHSPTERDGVSAVVGVFLAERGVWGLRVHNPKVHRQALDVWHAVSRGGQS